MHLFYKKKKPKYLNLYFGFFFSLPLAVPFAFRFSPCSWRAVALCSQNTTLLCKQACTHCYASSAHLFLFFLFPSRFPFAFRFSPCSWRAVALCSQSTTTLCKQACSRSYASSAHLFLFFSSSRGFIRIPLLSMLMARCRAMQPKHNCALQASLLAQLYFACAPLVGVCKL